MSDLIQWPRAQYWDKAWNPVIGCNPISPACANCYAKAWAERFGQSFAPHLSTREKPPRRGVVFCGNMTDLFGRWVTLPLKPIVDVLVATHGQEGDATYLWLTKRVGNMIEVICDVTPTQELLSDHYFGFTAENQEWYDKRFEDVMNGRWPQWANLWLSAEPLLGPIELTPLDLAIGGIGVPRIFKWIVIGCESGPKRRPCKLEWVESIVDQCRAARVPVFVKQLDIGGKCERDIAKFPKHLQIRQVPWAKNGGAR